MISILIPCFNAERWIGDAIESALSQSWQDREVIVADDGSTDGSLSIIKSFDDRIRWVSGPNRGGNSARNTLLAMARGEWVQYLDADDYLLPDKLRDHWTWLQSHAADADVVLSPVLLEHGSGDATWRELQPIAEPRDWWVLLVRWYLPQTGGPLWRKQAILDVGGWNPEQPRAQDYDLYLRLIMAGKRFACCPHAGAVYRQWSGGTVSRADRPDLRRRVLEIVQRAEDFLRNHNQLTEDRRRAINIARFEAARAAWPSDRDHAHSIMAQVTQSDPSFVPEGIAAPWRYRIAYRLLGFDGAETVAQRLRSLR